MTDTRRGRVLSIDGFRRSVSNLGRSLEFYEQALGFVAVAEDDVADAPVGDEPTLPDAPARRLLLRLGDEHVQLQAPIGFERHRGGANPGDPVGAQAFQHLAIVASDMKEAMARLLRFSPDAISSDGAARLPADSGGATAFKFRDPDGHPLELIAFADGGAGTRWQRPANRAEPTVGIDHSAIDCGDVEFSIAFYTTVLGLGVTTRHVNRGPAQAALDGIPGAVVDVVSLGVPGTTGFHIELLGYEIPDVATMRPGNALLEDTGDRLSMQVDDIDVVSERWRGRGLDVERIDDDTTLGRDPDGHLLLVRSRPSTVG